MNHLVLLPLFVACSGTSDDTDLVDTDRSHDTDAADTDVVDTDTQTEVDFDVPALLVGAHTDIPDEVMAQWPDGLGGSLTRHSAITGIEFHVPGFVSSERMSDVPTPVLREVNGTRFWQVTGELSGRFVDDLGFYNAVGPIDEAGVNHRAEPFDPYDPDTDPNDVASHPRAGLPGAFFVIRWPEEGYNGALVQNQACNDGGSNYPQAPLSWMNVDPMALLEAGYAVASVGTGASLWGQVEADGSVTVDSNPESGSGIFWTEDWDLDPNSGIRRDDEHALVTVTRPIRVDADFQESQVPLGASAEFVLVDYDANLDQDVMRPVVITYEGPDQGYPFMFSAPEFMSDAHVVFGNFLAQATGMADPFGIYLGWSGSGGPAWELATGLQSNAAFQYDESLGVAAGGGNFNVWGDPSSGTRFEAFVVQSGTHPWPSWSSQSVPDESWVGADARYPLQAPFIAIHADGDMVLPAAYTYAAANGIARMWAGSQMASESIDDWLVVLQPDVSFHGARDQLFANWDAGEGDEGAVWYDPALGDAPEAVGDTDIGYRITEPYARTVARNGPDDLAGFFHVMVDAPRITPMYLGLFASLREHAAHGTPLPQSRVDERIFGDTAAPIDENTLFPRFPAPCPEDGDIFECADGITENSVMASYTWPQWQLDATRDFASNGLGWSTEPLQVPDIAAPIGNALIVWSVALRHDFSEEELTARYGDHAGYVDAVQAANDALVEDGLWDADFGQRYVIEADESDILR